MPLFQCAQMEHSIRQELSYTNVTTPSDHEYKDSLRTGEKWRVLITKRKSFKTEILRSDDVLFDGEPKLIVLEKFVPRTLQHKEQKSALYNHQPKNKIGK